MVSEVDVEFRDSVAVLALNRPVANALSPSLRQALELTIRSAIDDNTIKAIVLKGVGQGFSSGVDIGEYEGPLENPWVGDLCHLIENAPKPIVAAMHGVALGAGFELALAAHARVADRAARVALPEVTLGLIPGAGGTQRLSRITGAQVALECLMTGRVIPVNDPKFRRVFEKLVDGDPVEHAIEMALELASKGTWIPTRDRHPGLTDPEAYQASVQAVAARIGNKNCAERDIVRCIEAAQLLPFEQGIQLERVLFEDRLTSKAARASRHFFAAERRANAMPDLSKGQASTINVVALLCQGVLAVELAVQCLDAGQSVMLVNADGSAANAVTDRVAALYDAAVNRERLKEVVRNERLARMKITDLPRALQQADIFFDDASLVLTDGLPAVKSTAVWASVNGENCDLSRLKKVHAEGKHVVLKHSRPAHSTQLIELAVPYGTSSDSTASVVQSLARSRRTVVRSALVPGLLSDNLNFALFGAALALCEAGVMPQEIDEAACQLGFPNGPFALADVLGLVEVQNRHNRLCDARSLKAPKALALLTARIAAGAKGRAVGRGIYCYSDGKMRPDPECEEWLENWHRTCEADRKPASDIGQALLAALVNEAARLISERRVLRASDLDIVAVKGMGFDRRLGGPLLQADFMGILHLLQEMKSLASLDQDIWTPHPKIIEMVKYGQGFFGRAT
ncbi:enoyl-CoA hydratase-related protein [Roseovarius sp. MMSF_3281]|uniref:enoyl-CoA hydratase-related protein n=1 Tax=Roseovarius sp. MMSF_3281 TaxID=3046694 RepID=UPI00273E0DE7|nr:enoyl-CoA hydratase-related protein [Roseovarius sp. MMSF_3281]